ncbi:MAG: hypothetical protein ABI199_07650 [Bacteroidia bacterium]
MKIKKDVLILGLSLGIIAPAIAFFCYYKMNYRGMPFISFFRYLKVGAIFAPVVSLCVLVNLGVFFGFIWTDNYRSARGVLIATFLYAGLVCYLKFFA